jgi:hypothetical protein
MLSAIAELLDAQETPLSDKQIACLDRLLFGGMGSLTDLWFDPASVGDQANSVNAGLDRQKDGLSTIALNIRGGVARHIAEAFGAPSTALSGWVPLASTPTNDVD